MAEMDLVPQDYRESLRIRRWVRNALAGYGVLLACVVGAKFGLAHTVEKEKLRVGQLQASKQVTLNQLALIEELRGREADARRRLDILAGLRGGPAAEQMFVTIDRALDQSVWFQSWNFRRAGQVVEMDPQTVQTGYFIIVPKGQKQQEDMAWRLETHMEIKGQAFTHSALASFVKRLLDQPEIEDVRVLNTGLRRYTEAQVVNFDLAVVVDSRPGPG